MIFDFQNVPVISQLIKDSQADAIKLTPAYCKPRNADLEMVCLKQHTKQLVVELELFFWSGLQLDHQLHHVRWHI